MRPTSHFNEISGKAVESELQREMLKFRGDADTAKFRKKDRCHFRKIIAGFVGLIKKKRMVFLGYVNIKTEASLFFPGTYNAYRVTDRF